MKKLISVFASFLLCVLCIVQSVEALGIEAEAISTLERYGVHIGEIGGGVDGLNRHELLQITMMAAGTSLDVFEGNMFSDVDANKWWAPYIWKAAKNNWVSGYVDGTFRPTNKTSVAEALKIMAEVLSLEVEGLENSVSWALPYKNYFEKNSLFVLSEDKLLHHQMSKMDFIITLYNTLRFLQFGELVTETESVNSVVNDWQNFVCPDPIIADKSCFFGEPEVVERDINDCPILMACRYTKDNSTPVIKVVKPTYSPVKSNPFEIILDINEQVACEYESSCVTNNKTFQKTCHEIEGGLIEESNLDWNNYDFKESHSFISEIDNDSKYEIVIACVDKGGNFAKKRIVFESDLIESAASSSLGNESESYFEDNTGILKVKLGKGVTYGERGSPHSDMKVFAFEVNSRAGNADIKLVSVEFTVSGGVTADNFRLFDGDNNTLIDSSSVVHSPGQTNRIKMSFSGSSSKNRIVSGGSSKNYYLKADLSSSLADQGFSVQIADLGNKYSSLSNPGDLIFEIQNQKDRSKYTPVYWVDQNPNSVYAPAMTFSSF